MLENHIKPLLGSYHPTALSTEIISRFSDSLLAEKQATINSAKIVRQDDRKGTVKVGKLADLIVVDGDPVADISLMNREPAHVLKSGKRVIL